MRLVIANKLYSSWSLRPWLVMRAFDIPFDEVVIPLRKRTALQYLLEPLSQSVWRSFREN